MADDFTSPCEIAELNIQHYKKLLHTPLDEQTRLIVQKLLAEEESRLALLQKGKDSSSGREIP